MAANIAPAGRRFYVAVRRGCPRRSVDAGRTYEYLTRNGGVPVSRMADADIIIIHTCGGFDSTEARSLATIRCALRAKRPSAQVIVTGCLLKINPGVLKDLGVTLVQAEELHWLDTLLDAKVKLADVPFQGVVPPVHDLECRETPMEKFRSNWRLSPCFFVRCLRFAARRLRGSGKADDHTLPHAAYSILVNRGCTCHCSYCAIKLSMGAVRSRPLQDILAEFTTALSQGHRMFVINGEDTGAYGVDIGLTYCDLLRALLAVPGDYRLVLNDVNAMWLINLGDELVDIISRHRDHIEDLRVPIQSGSDRILKLMCRPYRIGEITKRLDTLRRRVPGIRILTHIIVGFPSETDTDFARSRRLIEEQDFVDVGINPYQERVMMPSAQIQPKVPPEVIARRADELWRLLTEKRRARPAHAMPTTPAVPTNY